MQYEKIYKQMERREKYLYEYELSHGLIYYHDERELYRLCPDLYDTEKRDREAFGDECMRKAVQLALKDLEETRPKWYLIIIDYYFGDNINQMDLGAKYGIAHQTISKTLKRALRFLRKKSYMYLERLLIDS